MHLSLRSTDIKLTAKDLNLTLRQEQDTLNTSIQYIGLKVLAKTITREIKGFKIEKEVKLASMC